MATGARQFHGDAGSVARPAWSTWREAVAMLRRPAHLRKTVTITLLLGTLFFATNQLGLVLSGHANGIVWAKTLMTYLAPFCVSNYSILVATRARG